MSETNASRRPDKVTVDKGRARQSTANRGLNQAGISEIPDGSSRTVFGIPFAAPFVGRLEEATQIVRALHAATVATGSALVLSGEAGIGKTTLIEQALQSSLGVTVLRATGAEFEQLMPFAALHQLCVPLLDRRSILPPPQRLALDVAFGIFRGTTPDPFGVGLAVLTLLSECSSGGPIVCVIDDAHWIDDASASALAFVARRIESEHVLMLFATRDSNNVGRLAGIPNLELRGLSDADSRRVLASELHGQFDDTVRDRIVAEARGNPLALLEILQSSSHFGFAGGFATPEVTPTSRSIEKSFMQRVRELPEKTQKFLLVAAAEPLGDPLLLWKACSDLGITAESADAAVTAGLLEIHQLVRFRHPLVRSAIYRFAEPSARREAHQALAEATDPERDPDRRAWHFSQAALAPSEGLAAELDRSASRALARGGLAAAAAFAERAAELTPDAGPRANRTFAAARLALSAGNNQTARRLVTLAQEGPLNDDERAGARLQLAQIAFQGKRDGENAQLLLDAATGLGTADSRHAYVEAFMAALLVDLPGDRRLLHVARAIQASSPAHGSFRPMDLFIDGMAARVTSGYAEATPTIQRALAVLGQERGLAARDLGWLALACTMSMDVFENAAHVRLAGLQVELSRATGALAHLPTALNYRAAVHVLAGELKDAAALVAESHAVAAAASSAPQDYGELTLAAWRGDEARVEQITGDTSAPPTGGEGRKVVAISYATAVLHNGLGSYGSALNATLATAVHDEIGFSAFILPELIESAARFQRPELAVSAMQRLKQRADICKTDWAVGMMLRSQALLTDGADAGELFCGAVEYLDRTTLSAYVARTHLVFGEWLRRQGKRIDARRELQTAYEALSAMGIRAYTRRAATELDAAGGHARRHHADVVDTLTPQELNIARRAAAGATNREIAATLFLSPRTIDAHLRSIFRKTGATSRRQLHNLKLSDHPFIP